LNSNRTRDFLIKWEDLKSSGILVFKNKFIVTNVIVYYNDVELNDAENILLPGENNCRNMKNVICCNRLKIISN